MMNEENRPLVRRKDHHKKTKQRKAFNKAIIISILTVVACVVGVGSYFTYTAYHQKKVKVAFFDKSEQSLLKKIQEQQAQEGPESKETTAKYGKLETMLFVPLDKALPEPTSETQTHLQTLIQQEKEKHKANIPTKLVARVKKIIMTKSVEKFQPIVDAYTWDDQKQQWLQQTVNGKHSLLVNKNSQQLLSLKDLFKEQANFLAVQQVVRQKLLDTHPNDSSAIDKVLAMPNLELDKTNFTYDPEKITISLPNNQLNQKEITIDFKDIAGYLNPDYVDPEIIKNALPAPLGPNKKYISLTFDDGPNPKTTPKLLDILKEKNVKATFFMLGQNVESNTELVKRVKTEGHEVSSHSYSHPQLTTCSPETVREEVQKTDKAIYKATGALPLDFRPPYGSVNLPVAEIIKKPIIQWSVDSEDWKSKNTGAIIQRVTSTAYNDSIVLMHDIHPETVAAVPKVIDRLRADGYEIVPLQQLLGKRAKPLHMYYGSNDERPVS